MDYEARQRDRERRVALWGIGWPGHPDAEAYGTIEVSLRDEPERWRLIHEVEGEDGSGCGYDDMALLVRDDGIHVLVRTTGCSCPSPTETWGEVASGDMDAIRKACIDEAASWGGADQMRYGPFPGMIKWLQGQKEEA